MAVQKIVPTVEELEPHKSNQQTSIKRWITRKDVVAEFHCPLDTCLYGPNSERNFSCIRYLKQHYKKVHSAKTFSCNRCGRAYAVQSDFKAHEIVCGTVYKCSSCQIRFSTKEALQTHAKRKGHQIPQEHRPGIRSRRRKENNTASTSPATISPSQFSFTTFFIPYPSGIDREITRQSPRPILPKPGASLNAVPLPTVAAMALSELSYSVFSSHDRSKKDSQIQCQVNLRDASTQTVSSKGSTKMRKRTSTKSLRRVQQKTLQKGDEGLLLPTIYSRSYTGEYCWPSKLCQTYLPTDDDDDDVNVNGNDPLDVDVASAVSLGTQTSPRSRVKSRNPVSCDRFLDSPVREYFTDVEFSSTRDETETETPGGVQVQQWTQTEMVDAELESIPYDQLLSNMETQTPVDLNFFPELGSLYCDIQTQTVSGSPPAQLTNMETQTFLSFLETGSPTAGTL